MSTVLIYSYIFLEKMSSSSYNHICCNLQSSTQEIHAVCNLWIAIVPFCSLILPLASHRPNLAFGRPEVATVGGDGLAPSHCPLPLTASLRSPAASHAHLPHRCPPAGPSSLPPASLQINDTKKNIVGSFRSLVPVV